MGLNQQDSMAVANIVITGLAFLIYAGAAATSTSTSASQPVHRSSSVGGKTRRRRRS